MCNPRGVSGMSFPAFSHKLPIFGVSAQIYFFDEMFSTPRLDGPRSRSFALFLVALVVSVVPGIEPSITCMLHIAELHPQPTSGTLLCSTCKSKQLAWCLCGSLTVPLFPAGLWAPVRLWTPTTSTGRVLSTDTRSKWVREGMNEQVKECISWC